MELHCQVCRCILDINSDVLYCDKSYCTKVGTTREDLNKRIAEYVEHFKNHIPNEDVYREYLEKTGLEEDYKQFARIVDEDSIPKCSRRVWFHLNISLNHHTWPDEQGKLRHTTEV